MKPRRKKLGRVGIRLKAALHALLFSANIIAFAIVPLAAGLTRDWLLLGVFGAVELTLLLLAASQRRIRRWCKARRGESKEPLDYVLLWVTAAGLVVICFFGFGKHLLTHPFPELTHARGWEAGALVWTVGFLLYYIAKFNFDAKAQMSKVLVIGLVMVNFYLVVAAWAYMNEPTLHIICVLLIGSSFLVVDLIMTMQHTVLKERRLSWTSLWLADVPTVLSLLVLLVFLLSHPDAEDQEVFVSGIIAFQLLVSNAIFVVLEFDFLRLRLTASKSPPSSVSGGAAA